MVEILELDDEGREAIEVPSRLTIILRESQEIWSNHLKRWKGIGHSRPLFEVIDLSSSSSDSLGEVVEVKKM